VEAHVVCHNDRSNSENRARSAKIGVQLLSTADSDWNRQLMFPATTTTKAIAPTLIQTSGVEILALPNSWRVRLTVFRVSFRNTQKSEASSSKIATSSALRKRTAALYMESLRAGSG
jgi:hypothetical protein